MQLLAKSHFIKQMKGALLCSLQKHKNRPMSHKSVFMSYERFQQQQTGRRKIPSARFFLFYESRIYCVYRALVVALGDCDDDVYLARALVYHLYVDVLFGKA